MSHIEIINNLWLGNQYATSIFDGDSVLSIGCNPKKSFSHELKLSLIDSSGSDITKILPDALHYIHQELSKKHKILVHCLGGCNRSPIIVIAYLIIYKSMSMEDAIKLVKDKKPSIRIQKHYISQLSRYISGL